MSRGVVLIANNNEKVDYLLQAIYSAKRIKRYLNLPVTLITESYDTLISRYTTEKAVFDKIISVSPNTNNTSKVYRDGQDVSFNLEFKNSTRCLVYDLTPYEETIVLDTDVIVSNDVFLKCFDQMHDFLIYKTSFDVSSYRQIKEFKSIVDQGVDFYWATCIFFRKTDLTRMFFDLIEHIYENYLHYKTHYYITSGIFRNDFVFSIAIHILNGFQSGDFAKSMPGTLYFSSDKDELIYLNDNKLAILLEPTAEEESSVVVIKDSNVHVMNKFSIERMIKNDS